MPSSDFNCQSSGCNLSSNLFLARETWWLGSKRTCLRTSSLRRRNGSGVKTADRQLTTRQPTRRRPATTAKPRGFSTDRRNKFTRIFDESGKLSRAFSRVTQRDCFWRPARRPACRWRNSWRKTADGSADPSWQMRREQICKTAVFVQFLGLSPCSTHWKLCWFLSRLFFHVCVYVSFVYTLWKLLLPSLCTIKIFFIFFYNRKVAFLSFSFFKGHPCTIAKML